jgi:hypothetical protein
VTRSQRTTTRRDTQQGTPRESGRAATRPDPAAQRASLTGAGCLDALDWFTFVCEGCGQETFVGRELSQSLEDFAQMCDWLYGDPPVCTVCLHDAA